MQVCSAAASTACRAILLGLVRTAVATVSTLHQHTNINLRSSTRRDELGNVAYEFEHVPVEDVVVGEALAVEEVAEELSQVRVVGLVVEAQRATEVQVRGELGCKAKRDIVQQPKAVIVKGQYCGAYTEILCTTLRWASTSSSR